MAQLLLDQEDRNFSAHGQRHCVRVALAVRVDPLLYSRAGSYFLEASPKIALVHLASRDGAREDVVPIEPLLLSRCTPQGQVLRCSLSDQGHEALLPALPSSNVDGAGIQIDIPGHQIKGLLES